MEHGPAAAELISDRGAAAASDDLFRSPAFLAVEGVTHTLRIESPSRTTLIPVIVRDVDGSELRDAVSPYGYPGATVDGDGPPPDPGLVDWGPTELISVFVRDRLGEPSLAGGNRRSTVYLHESGRERGVRQRLAEQVRAAERAGWAVERTPGPEAGDKALRGFESAYEQTMRRASAGERYFFGRDYYRAVLGFRHSWLLSARSADGEIGAAAIAATSDGLLHYFLGGTADATLGQSPFKNVVVAMLDLADELGVPLNLGGGVEPGDGLERFKRGFANAELPFVTHQIVCDRDEYERLSAGIEAGRFFPAYRA
ncbi:MAG: GNAT family N-acetyltransferase [Solirubrobacterales bacterium]